MIKTLPVKENIIMITVEFSQLLKTKLKSATTERRRTGQQVNYREYMYFQTDDRYVKAPFLAPMQVAHTLLSDMPETRYFVMAKRPDLPL